MRPLSLLERILPLSALICLTLIASTAVADERKVLKLAFTKAETSLDPARIVDLYSRNLTAHIFEALYQYDHLARPSKIKPLTADGMPEASADFRVWTVKVKPGIYFADDPAFKGKPRELVAEDYVYALKRVVDPANKSPIVAGILDTKYVGLAAVREDAVKGNKPFDYDRPVEGLKAIDRYTIRYTLEEPRPRFLEGLAGSDLSGAVAREVVEYYGDKIDAHPVGTGPFRLKSWRRSSELVLERSPYFRDMRYDAEPATDDAEGQALLARFKGRRLPMIDEVRVSIIEESQPMWLAFLNGQVDALATNAGRVPPEFLYASHARRQTCALPRQARHPGQAHAQRRFGPSLLQHGRPGRRRLHALKRWHCAAPSAWRTTLASKSARSAVAASPRNRPWYRTLSATTRTSGAKWANTAPPARAPCSTSTATSTATATAGATCPTASRW